MRGGPVEVFGTSRDGWSPVGSDVGECAVTGPPSGSERESWRSSEEEEMAQRTLGVDLGIRAAHVATLCNEEGEVVWTGRRFRTSCEELADLTARVGDCEGRHGAHSQHVGPGGGIFQGAGSRRDPGASRAGSRPAPLLRQTHQERPAGFNGAGPATPPAPGGSQPYRWVGSGRAAAADGAAPGQTG